MALIGIQGRYDALFYSKEQYSEAVGICSYG